jgi:carbamoyltransferase
MYILGLSAFYHDSAACLIKDGQIIAAVQEERFTRVKHDPSFPSHSIKFCLDSAGILPSDLECIVFYEKPFTKFERLLETYFAFAPKGFKSFSTAIPIWIKEKLFLKKILSEQLSDLFGKDTDLSHKIMFSEHHLSHAASAFFPSPFKKAAVLTLDGVGEWTTTSVAIGEGHELSILREIKFPHSLGLLYSAFTYYTGFKVNSGEYKVMGLAPYGTPRYANLITDHLINIADDGSFKLNMKYFSFASGLKMTSDMFHDLFGGKPREMETKITQREMDLAASIQKVTEDVVLKLAKSIAHDTSCENLCLAGGVALNCVANGIINRSKVFKEIWIQPAAGDAGGAVGAALAVWHLHFKKKRKVHQSRDGMFGSLLGPSFSNDEIKKELQSCQAIYAELDEGKLLDTVAKELAEGKAVGWMQGKMEFGPRALGNRSILADPRSPTMQRQLNLKIKFRESFRPFAPSVMANYASEWFKLKTESPYMLLVAEVQDSKKRAVEDNTSELSGFDLLDTDRSDIPAVTHVDNSARVQTVDENTNPRYYKLIKKFYEITGCPILINTSFNVRGEPIVCDPRDAFRCFMGTELDILVIGNFLLYKNEQPENLTENYTHKYDLD